jgi:hypothetical protein
MCGDLEDWMSTFGRTYEPGIGLGRTSGRRRIWDIALLMKWRIDKVV